MIHIIIILHPSRNEGLPSCVAPENYHLKNGELTVSVQKCTKPFRTGIPRSPPFMDFTKI